MMGIVHIMLIGVIAWSAAAADKTALLLDESAYGPEEFNCVSVAAKLAWKDASMSEFQSIEPSKLRNEIDHLQVKYNLMQRFLELHDLGFQKFVGVSSSALLPILELAESDVRFEKSRVFPLEPISLPSARQAKLLNVAVYESIPSLAEFYTVLLGGSCPSDHDESSQVVIPFLVSNDTLSEELIASWNVALHKNMPSVKAQVEVTDPIFVGEGKKLVSALMEAQKVGAEPHIFVLDGGKGIPQLLRLIKKHSSLKNLPLHIHSAMAMNFQSSFRNIIECEGNIILHTVEYVGQDWHAPARRRLFSRLGSAMLKDSGSIQQCPPSAALIYKLILDVAADEPESRDGELVTAFYQRKHLKKKGEPLAVIVQDSPWVWDGPKTACGMPARGAGGSPRPSAEMIFKPAIDSLVEQKLGSNCSQVEVSFNAYDPWQYTLVKRTYPLQKLPYLTMLANVGGFWIEASCFKASVTSAYSIACTPNSVSNGTAVEGRFDHCSERLVEINLSHMERIVAMLKKDKEESERIVAHLDGELNAAVQKIKASEKMPRQDIEEEHLRLVTRVNTELRALEKKLEQQKNAEEQENLRRIQAQMEADRKNREEEAKRRAEEEELRKKKAELEARRKREEEEQKEKLAAAEATERMQQLKVQEQQRQVPRGAASNVGNGEDLSIEEAMARAIEEDSLARQQLEQERRDRELALRLAREMGVQVDEIGVSQPPGPPSPARSTTKSPQGEPGVIKKHDLTKWKYSDLRDAINTSCDVDLLEACREEFHRRLKVYHAWKAKNKRRDAVDGSERAPRSVVDSSARYGASAPRYEKFSGDESQQRFFRIPFVRPVGEEARSDLPNVTGGRKGWWYAHFDGQYVARQMEIHDQRVPVLLIAGKDDVHMCELSLEETGLTRKRGAEILEEEFEREWIRHGGPPYIRPAGRKIGK